MAAGTFLCSGLTNKALLRDSLGCDLVTMSESMSKRLIAFFLLDPPLRALGVLPGVFLPGVLRVGVFFPGVRFVRGLFRSAELISFLCGKKLKKILSVVSTCFWDFLLVAMWL